MKKFVLLTAVIAYSITGWAQKQNIQNAWISYKDKNYKQAATEINAAVEDPSTKDDPKAWYYRGMIYMGMQEDAALKAENPYREAVTSYMKVVQLKPGYEKDNVNQALLYGANTYFNDAVGALNAAKYEEAAMLAQKVVDIKNLEDGKRFASVKGMDTTAARAILIAAYGAYNAQKHDEALTYLNQLRDNRFVSEPGVYSMLADIYSKQNKNTEMLAVLEEARKKYPGDANIRNAELNYYIKTGQQDVLMKKLEEAVAAEPNSAVLQFNLANGYMNLAFPKDDKGRIATTRPANYNELITKTEAAYSAALKNDPDNLDYNYNTGVFFYNQATMINEDMNAITGNSDADNKKYEALKKQRNDMFSKAIPYFEKILQQSEPKLSSLSQDDKFFYQSALIALKEIYAKQDNMSKSGEMKKKLEALN